MLLALSLPPLAWCAWRLGYLDRPAHRWLAVGCATVVTLWVLPWSGVDFVYLKRANLLIAGAVVALLGLQRLGFDWLREPARERRLLGVLAAAAVLVHLNFLSFHGKHTWIHYHDVAHYYLGAKYFPELGYGRLYTAMLRSEAETYDNHFKAIEARDLETGALVHVRDLLERSAPVKARFSPERWDAFRADVALFRDTLGAQYGEVLRDHGFNPTPAWPLIGGPLANLVPAGSRAGVAALTALDPLLLAGVLLLVGRTFGTRIALLALIHYCLVFGATFGWIGGAFLRQMWFAATVAGFCLLARGRHAAGGALVGVATALRVFPAFFVAGAALRLVAGWIETRRPPRDEARTLLGFAGGLGGLVLATAFVSPGWQGWDGFRVNMERHLDSPAPNLVGLTGVFGYVSEPSQPQRVGAERDAIRRARLQTVFPATLVAVGLLAQRATPTGALVLGLPLLLSSLDLAAYYAVFLVLLTLEHRRRPGRLAAVFGLELACHALALFEADEAALYVYRSLLIGWLLVGLHFDDLRRELGAFLRWRSGDPPAPETGPTPHP